MKQLFLCHLITFLCYKSDLSVRLSCIFLFHLFHLFWRAKQMSKSRRFVVGTFVVVNGTFPLKV